MHGSIKKGNVLSEVDVMEWEIVFEDEHSILSGEDATVFRLESGVYSIFG